MSSELIAKVDEILGKADLPERHSYFQIEKFIIGKEVTVQAQMWQIVRELRARRETVESFEQQLEDAGDNLELLDIKIECQTRLMSGANADELNIREVEINIRKLQREKKRLLQSIDKVQNKVRCALEESRFLITAFERLEQVEELKSLDDRDAQNEYWNEKLLEEFNLRILLKNPVDSELVRTIMVLSEDAPVRQHVTAMLQDVQRSMIERNKMALERMNSRKDIKPEARIKGGR